MQHRTKPGKSASLLAWILLTALVSTHGVAQTPPDEPDIPAYTNEEVVVTGTENVLPKITVVAAKLPVSLQTIPVSVSVITQSLINDQGSVILGDALRNVSGANVQTGFGVHDIFVIRGFESLTSGLVLIDAVAEPEASFYNLYNIDRIEVLKGPGAFLYGGNPLSGTVSLSRKQPLFSRFGRVSGTFGRFGASRGTLDFGIADAETGIAFRLNALVQKADGYRDDKKNSTFAINPALTWHVNPATALTLNVEYIDSQYKSDAGLPIIGNTLADVPRTRSYQTPFDFSDQEIFRAHLDFRTEISPALTLRNKLYYTDFSWQSKGMLFSGAIPTAEGGIDLFRSLLILDDRQKILGNQLEAILSFSTGVVRHNILAGVEAMRWTDTFALDVAFLPNIGLSRPVETAAEPLFLIPGQSSAADARNLVLSPYLVDRIVFADYCQVFLGGRFDAIDYTDPVTATDRGYRRFSPMAGFAYTPSQTVTWYANIGGAFAPPSSRVVGDRDAEGSTQLEIGLKNRFMGERLHTTLAVYQLQKDNIAIPADDGITAQIGDQRSRGLEFELAVQPHSRWTGFAAYAFLDAELTRFSEQVPVFTAEGLRFEVVNRSGNTSAFAPRHMVNVWNSIKLRNGMGLGVGARYVSDQFIAEDNAYRIDGVLTFDAAVYFTYDRWQWRLNLRNVTNRRYETRGFGGQSVIPADPFGAYTTLALSL